MVLQTIKNFIYTFVTHNFSSRPLAVSYQPLILTEYRPTHYAVSVIVLQLCQRFSALAPRKFGHLVCLQGAGQRPLCFELRDSKIANEWFVMDETAVYAQIEAYKTGG